VVSKLRNWLDSLLTASVVCLRQRSLSPRAVEQAVVAGIHSTTAATLSQIKTLHQTSTAAGRRACWEYMQQNTHTRLVRAPIYTLPDLIVLVNMLSFENTKWTFSARKYLIFITIFRKELFLDRCAVEYSAILLQLLW